MDELSKITINNGDWVKCFCPGNMYQTVFRNLNLRPLDYETNTLKLCLPAVSLVILDKNPLAILILAISVYFGLFLTLVGRPRAFKAFRE